MGCRKPNKRRIATKCPAPSIKATAERLANDAIEKTIKRHADDARSRKERDERARLGARKRMTARIVAGILSEMQDRKENGLKIDQVRLAEIAADHAKQLLRAVGLESDGRKDKEHKSD